VRDIASLELWEVLRRRGTRKLADRERAPLEFAIERCTACRNVEECRRLLAADWDSGIEPICPNAMYLQHLDAMKRHATTAKR
jgi:hypothetical protein